MELTELNGTERRVGGGGGGGEGGGGGGGEGRTDGWINERMDSRMDR